MYIFQRMEMVGNNYRRHKILLLCILICEVTLGQSLTQNSNYFITQTSKDLTFIGSFDGINIWNNKSIKHYHPSTHNMVGNITQSNFYEDILLENTWFSNHEALHVYEERMDDFSNFRFKNPETNDTIKEDYRLIFRELNNIWVQAGDYTFLFDIKSRKIKFSFRSDAPDHYQFVVAKSDRYTMVSGGAKSIKVISLTKSFEIINQSELSASLYSMIQYSPCTVLYSTFDGYLVEFDYCEMKQTQKVKLSDNGIPKIQLFQNNIIVNEEYEGIYLYNFESQQKLNYLITANETGVENPKFLSHYLANDSTLWYCIEGHGCKHKRLSNSSFEKHSKAYLKNRKVFRINELGENRICIHSNISEFDIFDIDKNRIKGDYSSYHKEAPDIIDATVESLNGDLLFSSKSSLYALSYADFKIRKLESTSESNFDRVYQVIHHNHKLLACSASGNLFVLNIFKDTYEVLEVDKTHVGEKKITNIYPLNQSEFILSYDDTKLVRGFVNSNNELQITQEYGITGEIKSTFWDSTEVSFMLSTSAGLYRCDKSSDEFSQIMDKDKILGQTIYSIHKSKSGLYWLSGNKGIVCYNKIKNEASLFDELHGMSNNEFNSNANFAFDDGGVLLGSQNSLIYVNTDSIQLSKKSVTIHVSDFKINGNSYEVQEANTIKSLTLRHDQNQLMFGFHAIDYSIGKTKTKYTMKGLSDFWTITENGSGLVSYPGLPPGSYTFSILGANADGVWNPEPRNINITILPPWYATWWARTLGILLLSGLTYLTFRTYYKRQLREKDLQLREKNLIISKQQALAEERTRIAAEMHDDLGGGLTTIRFLSQNVLTKSTDQSIKKQVSKIVLQSETLVNNMSEIIWAMNAGFDTLQSLISYSRRYANRYLENYEIDLKFEVLGRTKDIKINGAKRRNIFLTIKEALHNIVKHSNANNVLIHYDISKTLKIQIRDNGTGLEKENELGNGFKNMQSRIQNIDGTIEFENKNGLEIILNIPI